MTEAVEIFTDGACSGNPGPGGWGAILRYRGTEKELQGGETPTTNNRMEMMAAIQALEALKRPMVPQEWDRLPLFARGAALRFLLTRLVDWLDVPAGALVRPKDPIEYLRKLRFHQKVKSARDYGVTRP